MRGLFVQRQIDVMVRFGNRTDAFDDRLPVLALVFAVEDVSIRRAGEDRIAAVPRVHRHAFDVGADVLGQSAGEYVPRFATVTAARDTRVGGMQFSPGTRTGLGAGDEQQIRIPGMNEKRIDVADSEISRRHALPGRAAVAADTKSCGSFRPAIGRRRGAVKFARIVGRNQHTVRVGIDAVDGRPGLAAVGAAQKAADFHRDVDDIWILRMKGDAFRVGEMRRAGESPLLDAGNLPQTGQLGPALAKIVAVK